MTHPRNGDLKRLELVIKRDSELQKIRFDVAEGKIDKAEASKRLLAAHINYLENGLALENEIRKAHNV